jgi:hypothetical protein
LSSTLKISISFRLSSISISIRICRTLTTRRGNEDGDGIDAGEGFLVRPSFPWNPAFTQSLEPKPVSQTPVSRSLPFTRPHDRLDGDLRVFGG